MLLKALSPQCIIKRFWQESRAANAPQTGRCRIEILAHRVHAELPHSQDVAQVRGITDGVAMAVVVEIDEHLMARFAPFADAVGPPV